jgi:hypothetical protein
MYRRYGLKVYDDAVGVLAAHSRNGQPAHVGPDLPAGLVPEAIRSEPVEGSEQLVES